MKRRALIVMKPDLHGDGPHAAFAEHIMLGQRKAIDLIFRAARPGNIHLRHSSATNPLSRPILQRSAGDALERVDEVAPLGIGISMFLQIKAETVAEMFFSQNKRKLFD